MLSFNWLVNAIRIMGKKTERKGLALAFAVWWNGKVEVQPTVKILWLPAESQEMEWADIKDIKIRED